MRSCSLAHPSTIPSRSQPLVHRERRRRGRTRSKTSSSNGNSTRRIIFAFFLSSPSQPSVNGSHPTDVLDISPPIESNHICPNSTSAAHPQPTPKNIRMVKFVGSLDRRDFLYPHQRATHGENRKKSVLSIHRRSAEGRTILLNLLIKALPTTISPTRQPEKAATGTYILDPAHELVGLDADVTVEFQDAIYLDGWFLLGCLVARQAFVRSFVSWDGRGERGGEDVRLLEVGAEVLIDE